MADQKETGTNWTIMMYIAADDVLANFAVESLKQLKRAVASNRVVVAAQFDADGQRNIPRLIFDGTGDKNGPLQDNVKDEIPRDTNMADPQSLTDFIDWAYAQCPANHYALVLWGHGPELLFDDYQVPGSGKKVNKFLAPSDLRKALADTAMAKARLKFDIVGIDACCMSMVELACELPNYAEFLVVSQEEVPDFSFPYDKLLVFGETKDRPEIAKACQEIPGRYIDAYQDYILTRQTNMASITLASLSLRDVATVTNPLGLLADALLNAIHDEQKRQAIIDARANSKGFVAGLYADLYDFCQQLRSELSAKNIRDEMLLSACEQICAAIRSRGNGAFVIENQASQDKHCHGISIYFPYLTDPEQNAMEAPLAPLVKGGVDVLNKGGVDVLNKGGVDVLNKGGVDVLNKVRRQRIEETEQYYYDLELSKLTHWGNFIKNGWSRCLVEDAEAKVKLSPEVDMSDVLDERYSAQQCALNLLSLCRELEKRKDLPNSPVGESKDSFPTPLTVAHLMTPSAETGAELISVNGNHSA
jgi:hypothetical protein